MTRIMQTFSVASVLFFSLNATKPIMPATSEPTPIVTNNTADIPDNVKEKLPDGVVIEKPIDFKNLISMYNESLIKNAELEQENKILRQKPEEPKDAYNEWHVAAGGLFVLTLMFISYLIGKQQGVKEERRNVDLNTAKQVVKPNRKYVRKAKPKTVEVKKTKRVTKKVVEKKNVTPKRVTKKKTTPTTKKKTVSRRKKT